jgi:hypothetical protein
MAVCICGGQIIRIRNPQLQSHPVKPGQTRSNQSAIRNPRSAIRDPQLQFRSIAPESGSGVPPLSSHPVKPSQTQSNLVKPI